MTGESKKYWPILVVIIGSVIVWMILVVALANDYTAQFIVTDPPYTDEMYNAFSDFYYGLSPWWALLTVVSFILCIKAFSLKTITGKIWLLLTIAFVLWFLGDFYYAYEWFFNFQNEDLPTLHFGRYCYIIGYIFILVGLASQIKVGGLKLPKKEYGYIALVEGIFLAVSLTVCVIPLSQLPIDGYYILEELDKGILIFYLIFDEVNIVLAIILIFKYRGGQFSTGWTILSIGFMIEAAYDMIYSYMYYILYLDNSWYIFEPIYYIVYVVLAVGALYLYIAMRSAKA